MKPPYEPLSRLLSGDLPEPEARAWRERIAANPDVARAWEELRAWVGALERLPEEAPPPGLDARILGRPRPSRSWVGAALVAAALALVAIAWWPSPAPEIALVRGEQVVRGAARIAAAGVPVAVDGVARVRVEPAARSAREPGAEVDMKAMVAGIGGAVVGSVLTVAVLEGTATVGAGGEQVTVAAGETRSFPVGGAAAAEPPKSAPIAERVAWLEGENERLRGALAQSQLEGALARGQVAQATGSPFPWPADVPPGFAPEDFEASIRAAAAKHPELRVEEIDCGEFPCMVSFTGGDARTLAGGVERDGGEWVMASVTDRGDEPTTVSVLAFIPPGYEENPDLQVRMEWRGKALMSGLAEE